MGLKEFLRHKLLTFTMLKSHQVLVKMLREQLAMLILVDSWNIGIGNPLIEQLCRGHPFYLAFICVYERLSGPQLRPHTHNQTLTYILKLSYI